MSVTKENLQEAVKLHTEWLSYKAWEAEDEETKGGEPPKGVRFVSDADLRHADLRRADLRHADLRRADLSDADLSDADLRHADLSDADLRHADLSDADLRHADLSDADLSHADLIDANLRHADLRRADLRHADLRHADLSDADLRGAIGNGREIKSAQVDKYLFAWTNTTLEIGCQQHPLKSWLEFDNKKKESFANDAIEYLNKWLPILDSMGVFDPVKETPFHEGELFDA